jgi:DNA-binding transcriptional LysR family regulator
MRLKHLEVFNAVMLTGSVSAAARLLHVSQPAVTQTLQHAEQQLGYPLFSRSRNRLVPTREAELLYPEVQRTMATLETVRRLAHSLRGGATAELRVLVVPSLAVSVLPGALALLRKRHPDLPVSVRSLHSREVLEAIALQEADVGIVYGSAAHPAVVAEPLATGRLVCVSRVDSPGADRRTTIELAEVVRSDFIRIDERDPIGAMLAEQCALEGLAPRGGTTVQTHHSAMVLAEQGFGPAIIESFTAAASQQPRLHTRVLRPEVPVVVQALRPLAAAAPHAALALVDAFKAAIEAA